MRKPLLITILLLLLPSFTLAGISYKKFDSFLNEGMIKILTWSLQSPSPEKYLRERSRIETLKSSLENLRTYTQLRPLIASDKVDKFEGMLRKDIDNTQKLFNRQLEALQRSERMYQHKDKSFEDEAMLKVLSEVQPNLKEMVQELDNFKKQLPTAHSQKIDSQKAKPQNKPELRIALSGPRLAFLHRTAKYTITITNGRDLPAGASELIYEFPKNLNYISSNPSGIFHPGKEKGLSNVSWQLKDIAPKETIKIEVSLSSELTGDYQGTVRLLSKTGQWKLKPQRSELRIIGVPAMHISTSETEDPVEVGKQTVYIVTTRNEGTAPCTNVQLENTIPEQMAFISASPNPLKVQGRRVVFPKVKTLQPGDKFTYKVVVKAIRGGSAKNSAVIRYDEYASTIKDEEGTSVY